MRHFTLQSLVLAALFCTIGTGCNSSGPTVHDPRSQYRATGGMVGDRNRDTTFVALALRDVSDADSAFVTAAALTFAGQPMPFAANLHGQDSLYWRSTSSFATYRNASFEVSLDQGTLLNQDFVVSLPDTFSITGVVPDTRLSNGNENVNLSWFGPNRAERYVIAAVKRGQQYQRTGYSQYVTSQTTDQVFDLEAFRPTGTSSDTGWYYVYVYALAGSPDSAIFAELLPVPLPSQLPDNITASEVRGRFGAVVVARRDSMRIAQQP